MAEIKYLLGIDGGGTKTEFLLTDLDGKEIRRSILGASNPVNVGIEKTKSVLSDGIAQVCGGLAYAEISVFAGIAGSLGENNKALIGGLLSDFGFGAYENSGDTDCVLELSLGKENGLAIIMGTGTVMFAQLDGVRRRYGGYGYLIDKGASGFNFGSEALNCAYEFLDGRGGSRTVFELVEKMLGKPLKDSLTDIYSAGAAYVASFAPAVFEAYDKGDGCAEEIIDRCFKESARMILAGSEYLGGRGEKCVICGGLCRRGDIITAYLKKHLGEGFDFEISDKPTVAGAVSLARSIIQR